MLKSCIGKCTEVFQDDFFFAFEWSRSASPFGQLFLLVIAKEIKILGPKKWLFIYKTKSKL